MTPRTDALADALAPGELLRVEVYDAKDCRGASRLLTFKEKSPTCYSLGTEGGPSPGAVWIVREASGLDSKKGEYVPLRSQSAKTVGEERLIRSFSSWLLRQDLQRELE